MQMTVRNIVALMIFLGAITCIIMVNFILVMMIGEINRKRDAAKQVSYFGFHAGKVMLIFREYKLLYPSRRFGFFAKLLFGCGVALLLVFGRMVGLPL